MAAVFFITFNSCKKTDFKNEERVDKETLARAKDYVAKQIKAAGGIPVIFKVNKPVTTYWADTKGNKVNTQGMLQNNFTSTCDYDYPAYCNMVQYTRTYICADTPVGYKIQFEYELSWNKNVVNNAKYVTSGNLEIYNSSNNYVQSYSTSNCIISDMGADPNPSFPNNHIFKVMFFSTTLPANYINGDVTGNYTVKASATFSTDCNIQYSLWTLPVTVWGFTGNSGLSPCDRTEKVWFLPPGNFNDHKIGVAGYDPLFNCTNYGGSFVRPDLQQVSYSLDSGVTWNLFSVNTAQTNNPILSSGYIRQTDFAETPVLTPGNYTVILRYRNWKYNGTPPNPLVVPIYPTTACRNLGIPYSYNPPTPEEEHASYTYEYWTQITILP